MTWAPILRRHAHAGSCCTPYCPELPHGHRHHASWLQSSQTAVRVVQEGLTNIVRHAKATQADLCIERSGGWLNIRLSDNGWAWVAALAILAAGWA